MISDARVLIDYLSFTFRPESATSDAMMAKISARHEAEKSGDSVNVWMAKCLGIDKKVKDLFSFVPNPQHMYTLLDTVEQGDINAACTKSALAVFESLKGVISYLDFRDRSHGYCGYTKSMELFRDGINCGLIAWGGKNSGVYVSLSGKGLAQVNYESLHSILSGLPFPKITRVDLAYDDFDGEYDYCWALKQYHGGGFTAGGNMPKCGIVCSGGAPDSDGGLFFENGRTFYVGSRKNGKVYRGYEKGRQMASISETFGSQLDWFRHEVEIHAQKRVIPLSVLLSPADYFVGAYPCLGDIVKASGKRISIKKKIFRNQLDGLVTSARNSYGKLITFLSEHMKYSSDEILELLKSRAETVPRSMYKHVFINV